MPPERQLGLTSATALVVANTIGTGVFTTSGFLLDDLGSRWAVLGVWLGGGVIAMLGALSYGALARRIPESGGEYLFLSKTLHPAAGYLAGWISLLVGFSAPIAAAAFAFEAYTGDWFPDWFSKTSGSLLILIFTFIHSLHTQRGAWVQNLAVGIKVLFIIGFTGWALGQIAPDSESVTKETPKVTAIAVSLVWVYFSYSGWNAAVYIGGEIRDPERNLPMALSLGTATVMILYLAMNAVFVFSTPIESLEGKLEVAKIAAEHLGGPVSANAVSVLISIALATSVSSMMMAGPRVYARMAADGYLPRWLSETEGPPRNAIILQSLLALAMLWSATFTGLLTYIGFTLGLSTAATIAGLACTRLHEGKSLKIPGWPWVPGLFVASILAISLFSIFQQPKQCLIGLATLFAGLVAWKIFYGRK